MKKEYWFVIALLIGVAIIMGSFYYISEVGNIPAYVALYISIVTAGYAALSKPDPNKIERQEIYGQLKEVISDIITVLERDYEDLTFGFWADIKNGYESQLIDKKLVSKLDEFLEGTKKYSSAI